MVYRHIDSVFELWFTDVLRVLLELRFTDTLIAILELWFTEILRVFLSYGLQTY